MPVMDGYELVKNLRDNNEEVLVLFLTAKSTFEDKRQGFELGIDDYVTKPIDYEEKIKIGYKNYLHTGIL
jgi:DNA-binding response OmpR family regulator